MKYMTIEQLIELGYLQEVNRRFFHPLGLALEASAGTDEAMVLRIQDARDDPEGFVFADPPDMDKARSVAMQHDLRGRQRMRTLGFIEQPLPEAI